MPDFNWVTLLRLMPILAGIANPAAGLVAAQLAGMAEAEIARRMQASGKTRDEVLEEAKSQWDANIVNAQALLDLGHEGDIPPQE